MTSFTQWAVLEAGKTYAWRMLGIDVIAIEEHLMKHPEYNKDLSLRDNILNLVGEHCMKEIDRNLERL
jgi:hypothetical protein